MVLFFVVFILVVAFVICVSPDFFLKLLFGIGIDDNFRDDAPDGVPEANKLLIAVITQAVTLNVAVVQLPDHVREIQIVFALVGFIFCGTFSGMLSAKSNKNVNITKYDRHSIIYIRWCLAFCVFINVGGVVAADLRALPGQEEPPIVLKKEVTDYTFTKGEYEGKPGLEVSVPIGPRLIGRKLPDVLYLDVAVPASVMDDLRFGTPKLLRNGKEVDRKYWPSRPTETEKQFRQQKVYLTVIPGLKPDAEYTAVFTLLPSKEDVNLDRLKTLISTEDVFNVIYNHQ